MANNFKYQILKVAWKLSLVDWYIRWWACPWAMVLGDFHVVKWKRQCTQKRLFQAIWIMRKQRCQIPHGYQPFVAVQGGARCAVEESGRALTLSTLLITILFSLSVLSLSLFQALVGNWSLKLTDSKVITLMPVRTTTQCRLFRKGKDNRQSVDAVAESAPSSHLICVPGWTINRSWWLVFAPDSKLLKGWKWMGKQRTYHWRN